MMKLNVAGIDPKKLKVKTDNTYLCVYEEDILIAKYWIYPKSEVDRIDYKFGVLDISFKDGMKEVPINTS